MIDDFLPPSGGSKKLGLSQRKPKIIAPPAPKEATLADWGEATPTETAAEPLTVVSPEAAADIEITSPTNDDIIAVPADIPSPKLPPTDKPKSKRQWPFSRKTTVIMAAVVGVLIIAGVIIAVTASHGSVKSGTITSKRPPKPVPKITTVASTLSGLQVDKSVNDRTVVAAMIENSPDARPQSGLDEAGVVYEALAEGGVTRFMAVFQDTQPPYIGPIRSARPYYVSWAMGYDAAYAHVGGSPDAINDINAWKTRDLNQFYNGAAYNRISSRDAPHNVYTSVTALAQLAQSKGFATSKFTGFSRKPEAKSKAPTATSIDFSFSGPLYNPHFDYNATTNSYDRSEGGAAHMVVDANGAQKRISPKVVIAIVVPESQGALDASGAYYSDYNPIGIGTAFVFQDGTVGTATWSKTANEAPLTLTDVNNKPFKLNSGQTWISAVTNPGSVTYK